MITLYVTHINNRHKCSFSYHKSNHSLCLQTVYFAPPTIFISYVPPPAPIDRIWAVLQSSSQSEYVSENTLRAADKRPSASILGRSSLVWSNVFAAYTSAPFPGTSTRLEVNSTSFQWHTRVLWISFELCRFLRLTPWVLM